MARGRVRALAVLALLVIAGLPGPATAAPPSCDAFDDGANLHPIPMSASDTTAQCKETLAAGVNDKVRLSWGVWRMWDLHVRVDLHNPGVVRVTRALGPDPVNPAVFEEQEGIGPFDLGKDLPLPLRNPEDREITEQIIVELVAGGVVGFTITVTRLPANDGDCGGGDTGGSTRALLVAGVACWGRFVDGWRGGTSRSASPYRENDRFRFAAGDDGDIVRVTWQMRGRTLTLAAHDGVPVGSLTVSPSVGYVATRDLLVVRERAGDLNLDVDLVYTPVTRTVCGELGCWTEVERWEDPVSGGPFEYNLTVSHTPNARPRLDVDVPPPAFVFDGDRIHVETLAYDDDDDPIYLDVSVKDTGGVAESVVVSPVPGFSGFRFTADTGAIRGTSPRTVTVGAHDGKGVVARQGTLTRTVDVYPADCVEGAGDAPASGRLFTGVCAGWVGPGKDPEDVLLFDATAGQRITFGFTGVGGEVLSPTGETLAIPLGGTYADYAAAAGRYRLTIRPAAAPASQPYTVTAASAPVSPPTGMLHVIAGGVAKVADGDLVAEAAVWLGTNADTATQAFDLPAALLAATSGARLRVVAQGGGCATDDSVLTVNSYTAKFAQCAVFPTSAPGWGTIAVPTSALRAGLNSFRLAPDSSASGTHLRVGLDTTFPTDRATITAGGETVAGGLAWVLELDLPANPDGSVARNAPVALVATGDDLKARGMTVTTTWGDGGTTAFAAPWRTPASTLHTFATPGVHTIRADGVADARTYTATASVVVRLPNDCGGIGDAPPEGRVLAGTSCGGFLAADDTDDVVVVPVAAGQHARFTITGADAEIVAPDGERAPLVGGVAHDYANASGNWSVRLRAPPGTTTDAPWSLAVLREAKPAPTGRVGAAIPPVWPLGAPLDPLFSATDWDWEDVAVTVAWGDGATTRVPATGFAASGTSLPASHAYAATGDYELRAEGTSRLGAALAPFVGSVRIVRADDCGAGDAPNTYAGDPPILSEAPCLGFLGPGDAADWYEIGTDLLGELEAEVCPFAPLALKATLYVGVPDTTGASHPAVTSATTGAGGCIWLGTGEVGTTLSTEYLLKIEPTGGTGAYAVRIAGAGGVREAIDPPSNASDALYTFDAGPEGFVREYDRLWSDVGWDAQARRVALLSDRDDTADELFTRVFDRDVTPMENVTISARWRATSQGNWQKAYPLFLAATGVQDLERDPNVIAVQYDSRDANLAQAPHYRLRYRDAAGALRLDADFTAQPNTEYRLAISVDPARGAITLRILAASGAALVAASYTTGQAPGDGFVVGKIGAASDGRDMSPEPDARGWLDDVRVLVR